MRLAIIFLIFGLNFYVAGANASSAPRLCLNFGCFYTRHDVNDGSGLISLYGREPTYDPNISNEEFERKYPIVFWNQDLHFIIIKEDVIKEDYVFKSLSQFFNGMYDLGILNHEPDLSFFRIVPIRGINLDHLSLGRSDHGYRRLEESKYNSKAFVYSDIMEYKLGLDLDNLNVYSSPFIPVSFRPNVFVIMHEQDISKPVRNEDYPRNLISGYKKQSYVLSSYYQYWSKRETGNFINCATTLYVDSVERDIVAALIYIRVHPGQQNASAQSMEQIKNCIPPLFGIRLTYDKSKPAFKSLIKLYDSNSKKPFLRLEDLMK